MAKDKIVFVKFNEDAAPLEIKKNPEKTRANDLQEKSKIQKTNESANTSILEKLKLAVDGKPSAFSKFVEMLNSLFEIIPEKSMCYAAALEAVRKSYGINAEQILSAMDDRLQSLQKENDKFSQSIEQNKNELTKYEHLLKGKDEKIETLKKQITLLETEKREIEKTASRKKALIDAKDKEFYNTFNMLKERLEKEKKSLTKHLKS